MLSSFNRLDLDYNTKHRPNTQRPPSTLEPTSTDPFLRFGISLPQKVGLLVQEARLEMTAAAIGQSLPLSVIFDPGRHGLNPNDEPRGIQSPHQKAENRAEAIVSQLSLGQGPLGLDLERCTKCYGMGHTGMSPGTQGQSSCALSNKFSFSPRFLSVMRGGV